MIDEKSLKSALEVLEQRHQNKLGYDVKEILSVLKTNCDRENEKQTRRKLRALISKKLYPEFKSAGKKDDVYCPSGKGSGKYRSTKYR